jgi:hypothetical protein
MKWIFGNLWGMGVHEVLFAGTSPQKVPHIVSQHRIAQRTYEMRSPGLFTVQLSKVDLDVSLELLKSCIFRHSRYP